MSLNIELDDILNNDEDGYVPSIITQKRPITAIKPAKQINPSILQATPRQKQVNYSIVSESPKPKISNMFTLQLPSANKAPTNFEDYIKKEKEPEKQTKKTMEKISSFSNLSNQNKLDNDTFSVHRKMKPPLSRKNQDSHLDSDSFQKKLSQVKFNKPSRNQFDPLQDMEKDIKREVQKAKDDQLQMYKNSFQKIISDERQAHFKQIEKLEQNYETEIKKKMELKEYEIKKLNQLYTYELNIAKQRNQEIQNLTVAKKKMQQSMELIERYGSNIRDIQQKVEEENTNQAKVDLSKREQALAKRQQQLKIIQATINERQKQLREQRIQFGEQKSTDRKRLQQHESGLLRREQLMDSSYRRRQKDLLQQFQGKYRVMEQEKQNLRLKKVEIEEERLIITAEKEEFGNKLSKFDKQRREWNEEAHISKTKILKKEIQLSSHQNSLQIKRSQVQMQQKQLISKIKLLDLEREKVTSHPISQANGQNEGLRYKPGKYNTTSHEFANYHKSITQMKDDLLKSLPSF